MRRESCKKEQNIKKGEMMMVVVVMVWGDFQVQVAIFGGDVCTHATCSCSIAFLLLKRRDTSATAVDLVAENKKGFIFRSVGDDDLDFGSIFGLAECWVGHAWRLGGCFSLLAIWGLDSVFW